MQRSINLIAEAVKKDLYDTHGIDFKLLHHPRYNDIRFEVRNIDQPGDEKTQFDTVVLPYLFGVSHGIGYIDEKAIEVMPIRKAIYNIKERFLRPGGKVVILPLAQETDKPYWFEHSLDEWDRKMFVDSFRYYENLTKHIKKILGELNLTIMQMYKYYHVSHWDVQQDTYILVATDDNASGNLTGSNNNDTGGIDLNPRHTELRTGGDEIRIRFPAYRRALPEGPILGLTPAIIDIQPVTDLPALIGLKRTAADLPVNSLP